jgi:hypothetical protein
MSDRLPLETPCLHSQEFVVESLAREPYYDKRLAQEPGD